MLWNPLFGLTYYCLEVISIWCFQTLVEHRKPQLQLLKPVSWDTGGPAYQKIGAVQSVGGWPLIVPEALPCSETLP